MKRKLLVVVGDTPKQTERRRSKLKAARATSVPKSFESSTVSLAFLTCRLALDFLRFQITESDFQYFQQTFPSSTIGNQQRGWLAQDETQVSLYNCIGLMLLGLLEIIIQEQDGSQRFNSQLKCVHHNDAHAYYCERGVIVHDLLTDLGQRQ